MKKLLTILLAGALYEQSDTLKVDKVFLNGDELK
jgi:hypothetical protein|tara:strand:- start:1436 stop:1537 length:102 start_codon:yes stop_codon:yes gene_type:complete